MALNDHSVDLPDIRPVALSLFRMVVEAEAMLFPVGAAVLASPSTASGPTNQRQGVRETDPLERRLPLRHRCFGEGAGKPLDVAPTPLTVLERVQPASRDRC